MELIGVDDNSYFHCRLVSCRYCYWFKSDVFYVFTEIYSEIFP